MSWSDPQAAEPDVPAATAASWRQAEEQLFSALIDRPDAYERVIGLVGATLDRLRGRGPSTQALLEAASSAATLVAEVADGGPVAGIDSGLVGRAALALRHREVVAERAAARRRARLADARADGPEWVVLEESGDRAGDPFAPYRRLEADPATGRAVLVTTSPDDDFRASEHAVQGVQVDLATGRVEPSHDPGGRPRLHRDATTREADAGALRDGLARPG